jgi:deazaflavin-dependent oxidoreductase (nitroreductase family)
MWIKLLMFFNVLFYRLTGGRLGGRLAGQSVLLLHSLGRKSGRDFVTPINYYRQDGDYVVVASNWGKPRHPGWFYNLQAQPTTTIQVGDQTLEVKARQAQGQEYNELWQLVTSRNDFYLRYQKQTTRKIPILILTPQN